MNKSQRMSFALCLAILALLLVSIPAQADTIYWTNWTSTTYGNPGSAAGTITFPGSSVTVTYAGENVYTGDQGDWNYPASYTGGIVGNVPSPANVSIQLVGGNTTVNTITFSQPVVNPIMAIQSLGQPGDQATYVFDQSFTLLAHGSGHWGADSPYEMWQIGNTLYGKGGNGIIEFSGVFGSISWTVPDGENYHMFTVGAPSAVPLPSALLLFGPGLVGLAAIRRRFKK